MTEETKDECLTGAEAIVYRDKDVKREFLMVKQKISGNISFVGGMTEEIDRNTDDTIVREIDEELNLNPDQYSISDTGIINDFVYGNHPTRAGRRIRKNVYLVKVNDNADVSPNLEEVRDAFWVEEEEALKVIWLGVLDIFEEVIKKI
ncbi:MAG: NUDIX domain-containing protein [Patescibacteria group bacterium]